MSKVVENVKKIGPAPLIGAIVAVAGLITLFGTLFGVLTHRLPFEFFFIQTTIVLGIVTVIGFMALLSVWYFMKAEGRFFFKRSFDNQGIDVIRHQPLTDRLTLITVKWTGRFFQHAKELIFFGVGNIINPGTDPAKYYNEVVSRMCTWAGSKRPVLIATDVCSHISNPQLLATITKARKHKEYEKADKQVQEYIKFLEKTVPDEIDTVTYMETIKPIDLTQFMEDIAARDAFDVYELGKRVNELERSKGIDIGPLLKWGITGGMILGVIILVYLVSTGQLQDILASFQK